MRVCSKRKDDTPQSTVSKIRAILESIGIFPIEEQWYNPIELCFSVFIKDCNHPFLSSSGKGTTRDYALASAYAELIERIQNRQMMSLRQRITKPLYGLINDGIPLFLDEIQIKVKDLYKLINKKPFMSIYKILKPEVLDRTQLEREELPAVPYLNIIDDSITYLPHTLIYELCFSNGMCSGNTPEEAISHGLCEIIERFVMNQVLFSKYQNFPNVPLKRIRNLTSYELINQLEKIGYRVIIKDCSLGGRFPVICCLIIDKNTYKAQIHFGCDPNLDIAIERSITEMFQCILNNDEYKHSCLVKNKKNDYFKLANISSDNNYNRQFNMIFRSIFNKPGVEVPKNLLFSKGKNYISNVFCDGAITNKEALKMLLRSLDNHINIYIRDVSFLGFPSYHIYIPGMSEIRELSLSTLLNYLNYKKLKNNILCLKLCDYEELNETIGLLESMRTDPFYSAIEENLIMRTSQIYLSDNTNFRQFQSLDLLLFQLSYKIKKFSKAYYYLVSYLENCDPEKATNKNYSYFECCKNYVEMRCTNNNEEYIKKRLLTLFERNDVIQTINDLSKPDNILDDLKLPKCGNCAKCEINNSCYYESWYEVNRKIIDKMEVINQKNVELIFNE